MATEDMAPEPMTREEAKRILRRLELDAYSAVVTAFRAQGDINKSKKAILNELSNHLSISTERHRAEVRRVVNDDRLNAVAGCMHGPGTSTEWSIEGRRLVSLMPRLVPQTVFTAKASAAANQAVESNQKLPIKTEIEVLPLPTKPKQLPPKSDRSTENKEDKSTVKLSPSIDNTSKFDDKAKKKKKPNILYTKPSPLALNKTLTNPFKPSTPSSLKPMIKSNPLKYSSGYSLSKPASSISSPVKYSPKPIILQRSPTKSQPSLSRPPGIQLQSLNASNVNTPLTSLSSLGANKSENSLHLIQSPMIKVVSSSLQNSINSSAASITSLQNSSITQKIKFKTPLPKPKVKATKFKPMVPLQRAGLLSSVQSTDSIMLGTSTNPISPNKPVSGPQGVSVKVVQVAKSSISNSASMLSNPNKPVVVVSSNLNKTPSQRVLAFSSVASSVTQQIRLSSNSLASSSITQTMPKGTLTSKSMPLATGFKMIAVTTVVPGTTQVKTVYIATPIMSLTKTVSQTTGTSITTPAAQTVKHIPNSLASNLHSVVARSMGSAVMNHGKAPSLHGISSLSTTIATPSTAVGKTSKMGASAKGLGSLKTTLSGSAQSLKLFTAVSKSRSPLSASNTMKNAPLLPSTSLMSTVIGQQNNNRVGNIQMKNTDSTMSIQRNDKQQVLNVTHQVPGGSETSNFLSISGVGVGQNLSLHNNGNREPVREAHSLTLNVNNFEDVNSTLNLLNDENTIATEQITASATAETDDMAFLNAGEKFLEQLSAKMTATSPDSLTKNESFFPANLSIDLANEALNQNRNMFVANELDINTSMSGNSSLSGNASLSGNTSLSGNKIISYQNKHNAPKDTNYLINQKSPGSHNIGIVTTKVSPHVLNNNISLVNAKFNLAASNMSNMNCTQGPNYKTVGNQLLCGPGNLSLSAPSFQQKHDRAVLNYPNITKISGKIDSSLNSYSENNINVGFINVGSTLTIENNTPANSGLKLSSLNQSNKLQMSMPGSSKLASTSKLNISPVIVNNNLTNSNQPDFFTQICTTNSSLNNTVHFSTINTLQTNAVLLEPSSQNSVTYVNHKLDTFDVVNNSQLEETCNGKKRKLIDSNFMQGRTQASWIRGAANLLARVSRFRGTNKLKGEMNAASWFTKPVDPNDAPGYYRIIKVPMDFGKIKRKLEDGEYDGYPKFYDDMLLIKKNCYLYNPDGHVARKDCDDVFSFFESEYQKLLERWEKHHGSPHKKLKLSSDDVLNPT